MSSVKIVLHGYLSLAYLDRECTLKVHSVDNNTGTTETGYGTSFTKIKKIVLLVSLLGLLSLPLSLLGSH